MDRRIAVEKELSALGDAKKGQTDVFRHCRGFERAFQIMLNEANVAFKIRAVVEGVLPETLQKIPIEKRFNKNYTREICREADGYQPHLVSPEKGIKRLVQEAMKLTTEHVHRFVDEIHMVLMETVREAARRSVMAEGTGTSVIDFRLTKDLDFLRLKGFENAVIMAASQALEEWRAEAHRVADIMVQMECDYVTPSFFRELERKWQEEAAGPREPNENGQPRDRLDALAAGEVSAAADGDGEDSDAEDAESTGTGAPSRTSPSVQPAAASSPTGNQVPPMLQQRADLKSGWLEKRAGDSSNLSALPVDSWRWQKRWFVLAMEAGYLYYFPSPSDVAVKSPKVVINMRECIVEDFQPEGAGMPTRRSTQRLDNNAGSVSLLIRVSHRNPNLPVAKNHHQIILRAADAGDKYDWLARLRNATEPGSGTGKGPKISGSSSQYLTQGGPQSQQAQQQSQQLQRPNSADGKTESRGLFGRTLTKVTDQFTRFTGLGNSKMGDVITVGSIQDLDAYYEKLGNFCGIYARAIYTRMAKTVPKAIILCQVIRSRDRLLDQLFNYISSLSPKEVEYMLQEDPVAGRRRTAAQQASKDLTEAAEEVRKLQEQRAALGPGRSESEEVSVRSLLLAGAFPLVPKDWVPAGVSPGALYGEHTPISLSAGPEAARQLGPKAGPEGKRGDAHAHAHAPQKGGAGDDKDAGDKHDKQEHKADKQDAVPPTKPRRQPPPPPPQGA